LTESCGKHQGRPTRFLDYECYEAMAVKMMADIGREIAVNSRFGRIGWLTAWDASRSRSERDDSSSRAAPESAVSCGPGRHQIA